MKVIFYIKVWIFWICHTRLYPTSEVWSKKLQCLIDKGCKLNIIWENDNRAFRAEFGDELIWIENAPYASFTRCNEGTLFREPAKFIPNKKVGYILYKMLEKAKRQHHYVDLKLKLESSIKFDYCK